MRIGESPRIPNIVCITLREELVIKQGVEDDKLLITVRGNKETKATIEIFNAKVGHPEVDSLWFVTVVHPRWIGLCSLEDRSESTVLRPRVRKESG